MHTSAIVCFALAVTAHAVPIIHLRGNNTVHRRSAGYDIVNVGGDPSPATPAVLETVTAPSAPQPTVTVFVPEVKSIASPTSSPCSSSATPSPSVSSAPTAGKSHHGLDRIADMLGKSLEHSNDTESRLRARNNETSSPSSRLRMRSRGFGSLFTSRSNDTSHHHARRNETVHLNTRRNETTHMNARRNDTSRNHLRGANPTEGTSIFSRRSLNSTDPEESKLKYRGLNGTSLQARNNVTRRWH